MLSRESAPTAERILVFSETKREIAERALAVFQNIGASAELIGSANEPRPDFFSDIDVSVVHSDDKIAELVDSRHDIYEEIHPVLFTWERPRFAPLGGGKHSIVMFDAKPGPVEMDVFLFPESERATTYREFGQKGKEFPWEEGEDLTTREAKLNYLLCVSYWALKYISRGETGRIEWLKQRYSETRQFVPELPPLSDDLEDQNELAVVERVISTIHTACENAERNTVAKFRTLAAYGKKAYELGFFKESE